MHVLASQQRVCPCVAATGQFSIRKNENPDGEPIPRSRVTGQAELGLLDERTLEEKDGKVTHPQSGTVGNSRTKIKKTGT